MQKYLITVLVLIISASCSMLEPYKNPIAQGNYFTPEETEKLKIGLSKNQVEFIMGASLSKSPFNDKRWEYYNSLYVGDTKVTESKLTIFFDEDNKVSSWIIE